MAFKTFTVGEVLTAADVNTYLMKQTLIVCTSSTRPSSPAEGWHIYETDTDTFLYYSGAAWVIIPTVYTKVKTNDETVNNSTTLQNDDHLIGLPLGAPSATYRWTFEGTFDTTAVADFKFRLILPASATARFCGRYRVGGSVSDLDPATAGLALNGDGALSDFQFTGWILTSGTAGVVDLQWAQNTAEATNTIVRDGTTLTVVRVS